MSLKYSNILFIAGIIFLALLLFYPLLAPGYFLFTTDDNVGMMPAAKAAFPSQLWGQWGDQLLYGLRGSLGMISWTPILMGALPVAFIFNWIHAIDLVLASIFLLFFLRADKILLPAIALGILTAFWLGSNLTLVYAGHISKFTILMLSAAVLRCLKQIRGNGADWCWGIIAGGLMGLMLIEQQDVALFFGIFLGLYAVFNLVRRYLSGPRDGRERPPGEQPGAKPLAPIIRIALLLLIIPAVAMLVSSTTLFSSYAVQIKAVAPDDEKPDRAAKWAFATQWSWPPEESIDFIAPGYMGWRSGESAGPYWGRMGRSAGWEQTGRGFMNFKLENQYLGAIPLVLAFFAVVAAFFMRVNKVNGSAKETADWNNMKAEIFFWFGAALLALLLSFGKYFPLYKLFYQLPLISEIRNPNKFLQVFQLAAGILTAYGAHLVFNWRNPRTDRNGFAPEARKH